MNKRHDELAPISDYDFLRTNPDSARSRETRTPLRSALRIGATAIATVGVTFLASTVANRGESAPFGGVPTTVETIKPGDTLWGKARGFADEQNVKIHDVIADITEHSPDVQDGVHPGDQITRPVTQDEIAKRNNADASG